MKRQAMLTNYGMVMKYFLLRASPKKLVAYQSNKVCEFHTSHREPSTPRPKQRDETDRPSSGVVYRINYSQCDFVYYGQTERALKTQVSEHKQAVVIFVHNSTLPRAMFTSIIIVWSLKTSKSSDRKHITISGFFYRLGCL